MATLWLLRHAKSAWDDPDLPDHARPLSPRGRRACEVLRAHCEGRVEPERVLCSTAVRTRQTLQRVFPALDPHCVRFDEDVYEAPAQRLATCLERHGRDVQSLLLVGHNPGLQSLAMWLAAPPDRRSRALHERLHTKVPTGALLTFELASLWPLERGGARLEALVTPKRLAKA